MLTHEGARADPQLSRPFSRWREKVPGLDRGRADEGGSADNRVVLPSATLTRGASRLDVSRQPERCFD
jgi:hypothetical protein